MNLNRTLRQVLLVLLLAGFQGFSRTDAQQSTHVETRKHNLNVVYFIPQGFDTLATYRQRWNGLLMHMQNFYRQWMTYWGYTGETFGLARDNDSLAKITLVYAAHDTSYYPYSGGGGNIITEVNSYFAAHPENKFSTHTLIVTPNYGRNPFYGLGNGWCFALDRTDLDTANLALATYDNKWIGGTAHELGHGLNLPHNKEYRSQKTNTAMGTALMGSGNYTYGKSATFLTQASCATLHESETFRTEDSLPGLYGGGTATITAFHGSYANGYIHLSGTYASTQTVSNVLAVNWPPAGDYNQLNWLFNLVGNDSFHLQIPINEFWARSGKYQLQVKFLFQNGSSSSTYYNYAFADSIPVIDIDFSSNQKRKNGLAPIADTYIRNGSYASTNYGLSTTMDLKPDSASGYLREVFLKFRLSDFTGSKDKIGKVKLGLYVSARGSSATDNFLTVRRIPQTNWDNTAANSMTWNKWVADSTGQDSITGKYSYGGNWVEFPLDKASLLQSIRNGDSVIAFHITSTFTGSSTAGATISFASMEAADSLRPYLLLETASTLWAPTADTYIRNGSYATTNYGLDSSLYIKPEPASGYQREGFLLFSLAGFEGNKDSIRSLKLVMKVRNANTDAANTNLNVWLTNKSDWGNAAANSLTWNKWAADSSHVQLLASAHYNAGDTSITWDITSDTLLHRLRNGDNAVALHLQGVYSGSSVSKSDIQFYSMESSNAAQRPYLLLNNGLPATVLSYNDNETRFLKSLQQQPWGSNTLKLYPNPASSVIYLRTAGSDRLAIYDITGRRVRYVQVSANQALALDVSGWKAGVYFLRGDNTPTYKLVVNH